MQFFPLVAFLAKPQVVIFLVNISQIWQMHSQLFYVSLRENWDVCSYRQAERGGEQRSEAASENVSCPFFGHEFRAQQCHTLRCSTGWPALFSGVLSSPISPHTVPAIMGVSQCSLSQWQRGTAQHYLFNILFFFALIPCHLFKEMLCSSLGTFGIWYVVNEMKIWFLIGDRSSLWLGVLMAEDALFTCHYRAQRKKEHLGGTTREFQTVVPCLMLWSYQGIT